MECKRPVFRQGEKVQRPKRSRLPRRLLEQDGDGAAAVTAPRRCGQGSAYPTNGGNSVSFGVPMRRDSCTSQGLQPWLISTSDCTDMYM